MLSIKIIFVTYFAKIRSKFTWRQPGPGLMMGALRRHPISVPRHGYVRIPDENSEQLYLTSTWLGPDDRCLAQVSDIRTLSGPRRGSLTRIQSYTTWRQPDPGLMMGALRSYPISVPGQGHVTDSWQEFRASSPGVNLTMAWWWVPCAGIPNKNLSRAWACIK